MIRKESNDDSIALAIEEGAGMSNTWEQHGARRFEIHRGIFRYTRKSQVVYEHAS